MPEFAYVADPRSLDVDFASFDVIGVDTEFMREKTLFAELCLVQVSVPGQIYCIDPLGGSALDPFWENLAGATWVAHSARQDIEVLYQSSGRMPRALFDTQVAAGLVGLAPQIGYAGLVKSLFDVDIAKSQTRADWTRRPLPAVMLEYAAEDVEWLLPAWGRLAEALEEKGRLEWALEDSAQLLDRRLYEVEPSQAVERLKGARNLGGRRRAIAEGLAEWREKEAIRSNRPRQWIMKDATLLEIASAAPRSLEALKRIDSLPPRLAERAGRTFVGIVAEAERDDGGAGGSLRAPPPDEPQKALLKRLQAEVAAAASELGIAPETIAARRDLAAAVTEDDPDTRIFSGWRRGVIGERVLDLKRRAG